jgi:hypothetical protein
MLVDGVVVEHHMDNFADRDLLLDRVTEPNELLMTMALHAAADHFAFEDIEGSKQCGRVMPFVIVRQGAGATLLHRQPGLGAIERLDLRLFVDREHDRVCRWVVVEADDLAQLLPPPQIRPRREYDGLP